MDNDERRAIEAEGLNPDAKDLVTAIDFVRWELSMVVDLWQADHSRPDD